MSEQQFIEARKLIDSGVSIRKAAEQVRIPYPTLRRRLRNENPQAAPEPESESESEPWRTIRRHENETRKRDGLPPLSDVQWAARKAAMEECQRQMEQL